MDNYCTRLYHFESILSLLKNEKNNENISYITLCMFLNIVYSLHSIQIIQDVSIIHLKGDHVKILKTHNVNTSFDINT